MSGESATPGLEDPRVGSVLATADAEIADLRARLAEKDAALAAAGRFITAAKAFLPDRPRWTGHDEGCSCGACEVAHLLFLQEDLDEARLVRAAELDQARREVCEAVRLWRDGHEPDRPDQIFWPRLLALRAADDRLCALEQEACA